MIISNAEIIAIMVKEGIELLIRASRGEEITDKDLNRISFRQILERKKLEKQSMGN